MAYCSLEDLKKALPEASLIQLTDDESLGAVNEERVSEAISKADGEIDGYIGGRYSVPLSTVPDVIRRCSVSIAVYLLYTRTMEDVPDTRRGDYKDALRILERIQDGKMTLNLSDSSDFAFGVVISSHFEDDNSGGLG